jgi:hypothetical protein
MKEGEGETGLAKKSRSVRTKEGEAKNEEEGEPKEEWQ